VGAAFGGGNTQGVFGAGGATSFLGKLTYGAAAIFMITSISLVILEGKSGHVGLSDKLKAQQQETVQPTVSEPEANNKQAEPAQPVATPTQEPATQN
jgi:preprotein translocase subunit SecG